MSVFDVLKPSERYSHVLCGWIAGHKSEYMETLPEQEVRFAIMELIRPFTGDNIVEIGANWIHGPSEENPVFRLAREYRLLDPEALTPENQAMDIGGHPPWVPNVFSSSGRKLNPEDFSPVQEMFAELLEECSEFVQRRRTLCLCGRIHTVRGMGMFCVAGLLAMSQSIWRHFLNKRSHTPSHNSSAGLQETLPSPRGESYAPSGFMTPGHVDLTVTQE